MRGMTSLSDGTNKHLIGMQRSPDILGEDTDDYEAQNAMDSADMIDLHKAKRQP